MKSLTSLQNKSFFKIWLAFHGLVLVGFLAMFCTKKSIKIDVDLFNMLPKAEMGKALNAADEKLTEVTGQNVFILVSNPDFSEAKKVAGQVYEQLKDSTKFKSISLYQDTESFGAILNFLGKYKYNLLEEKTLSELNAEGGAEVFAQDALSKAYGAFTLTSLENLENDPFMLTEHCLLNYLDQLQDSGTKMSLKDEVLASEVDGRWYIMIRAVLSKEGSALASKSNAVVQIRSVCDALEKGETRFIYSGIPFHSYKSSTNATKEISLISTISLLVVLVILLLIFGRFSPIVCSVASILCSSATAVLTTLAIFGKMHILTLLFGTSLIGSCIDYSLHYFINWKGNLSCHKGFQVRNHLIKGLSLSLISTLICYFILIFAPFNLLKQMAVFSISGIFSSFLSVICLYPFLKVPKEKRNINLLKYYFTPSWYNKKFVGRIAITVMFILSIGTILIFHKNVRIENDLKNLYKKEGREMTDEIEAAKVLQYSPSGWFIVSGNSPEETLQNEEKLAAKLRVLNEGKEKGGFVCTSAYIPSVERQKKSRAGIEKLLPLAEEQFEYLGYENAGELAAKFKNDFNSSKDDFIEIGKNVPEYLLGAISSAWLGEIEGKYYSVILPVSVTDYDSYKALADGKEVFFVSKVASMNQDLDRLSSMILKLFAVVYVILFIILKFFYSLKQTCKIISVPLLIILWTAAIFAISGIYFEFFSITGLILVFGLGLDYVIYMIENEKRTYDSTNAKLEPFAIALSFVTTAVSFGALALSKFVPVHMIGLAIFIGLTVAFVSTFFYTRADF
ncbi:MAG: hypothetical protein K6F15_05785 [Treponema sp.]|nr:hypothetical protein [Treponema sp.]